MVLHSSSTHRILHRRGLPAVLRPPALNQPSEVSVLAQREVLHDNVRQRIRVVVAQPPLDARAIVRVGRLRHDRIRHHRAQNRAEELGRHAGQLVRRLPLEARIGPRPREAGGARQLRGDARRRGALRRLGARAALEQSGLPYGFWSFAVVTMGKNISMARLEMTSLVFMLV